MPNRLESIIPPMRIIIDNTPVNIYEVTKSTLINGETWYHVYLSIGIGKNESRRFSLSVRNFKELRKKLLIEVSKYKFMRLIGRQDLVMG